MQKLFLSALVGLFAVAASSGTARAQAAGAEPTAVGDWAVSINTPQGLVEVGVSLKVAEPGKLSGTAKGEIGEFPVTGTIDDKGLEIRVTGMPGASDVSLPVDVGQVIVFLSR